MTNELRIGNIVQSITGVWLTVIQVSPTSIMYDRYDMKAVCGNCPVEEMKGIPLTPEWLEGFGIKNEQQGSTIFNNGRITIHEFDDGNFRLEGYSGGRIAILYVHQLQNLYFALTASELPVNLQTKKAL
jgi:hypothetical protein